MSCTVGYSPCSGFSDGAGSFLHWVGMDVGDGEGQLCGCCCEIGCESCTEESAGTGQAWVDGQRWLRPAAVRDGRDARGLLHDLKTNEPHRVPVQVTYDKAPCFDMDGHECYGDIQSPHEQGLCRCDDLSGCGEGDPRCAGVPAGGVCGGLHPDRFTYKGHTWTGGAEHFRCRETFESAGSARWFDPVRLFGNPLYQAAFVRSDNRSYHCTSNRMSLCGGVSYGSECVEPPPHPGEYYIGEDHQAFSFCTIDYDNVTLAIPPGLGPSSVVVRQLKALAIQRVTALPGLNQLDYRPFLDGPRVGNNSIVDRWGRTWGFGLSPDDWRAQGNVATFNNCKLRQSGCPVRVELFVRFAAVEMSLVAHRTINRGGPPNRSLIEPRLWPSVRIRLYAELGIHAELIGPCVRSRHGESVALEVVNDPAYVQPPVVSPIGADSIVFLDDAGTEFIPPVVADWWGYHGEFGAIPWEPVEYNENENTTAKCCQLGYYLHGTEVRGWPTASDSQPEAPASLYLGKVTLGFRTSNWCTNCAMSGAHPNPPECDGGGGHPYIPPVGVHPRGIDLRPIGGPLGPGLAPESIPPVGPIGGPVMRPSEPSPLPPVGPIGGPVQRPIHTEPVPPATAAPFPPSVVPIGAAPYPDPPISRPSAPPPPKPPRPRPIPPVRPGRRFPVGEFNDPPRFII